MKSATRTCERSLAVLVVALCVLASGTYAADTTALTNGVAVTGISGTAGSERFYRIEVPAGQDTLTISTSGGTGDVDLYVRRDALPTTMSYDYRPYKVGNNETVEIENPVAGTWYIMLRGYVSYSGVTLKATYAASVSVKALTNGVAATGISGAANAELYFSIEVPADQTKLDIAMSGGTGDADLYVKKGSLPTTTSYDYRPFLAGNNETVSVNNPAAGTWYIMIRGYSAYAGITLLASYRGGATGTMLEDGVPVPNLAGTKDSEKIYQIDLPAGVTSLDIQMSGGTGDADLYVRFRSPPTTTEYDHRPFQAGNNESVTVNAPSAGTWFVMVRGYSDYAGVTLKASWGAVVTLQNGVPVTNISGALGSEKFYKIDVPGGMNQIQFAISGGSGNADMYIRKGTKPTTSTYDHRPADPDLSNNESATATGTDLAGTWYILLKAAKAYQGLTLSVKYSSSSSPPTVVTLSNGVPVKNISGSAGTERFYRIEVPAGQQKLEIQMSGGTGDADLYVRRGSQPTTSQYDYRPYLLGNDESVAVTNPAGGTWYIMIRGYSAFAGITLLATYGGGTTPDPVTTLQNGVAVTGIKGEYQSETFYKIDVPAGQSKLEVAMSGGTGDVDLYVRRGSKPTTTQWDYRPYLIGNDETVTINNPPAGTYYIMLHAYLPFDGVTLKATYTAVAEPIPALTNGVPVTGLSGAAGSEKFYRIVVPAGQQFLTIETSGGTGDVDLYVKRGAKPTVTSWDYRPYLIGNDERVEVTNPAAATWYIMLRGYQAYAGLTLKATYGVSTPPPSSGNNFASDPRCVALWRFESGQLTTDSVGTHMLESADVVADTLDYKEGSASVRIRRPAAWQAESAAFYVRDTNLGPKFPGKNGTANKTFTICFWTKFAPVPDPDKGYPLVTKDNPAAGKTSFAVQCVNTSQIALKIGTGTGATSETLVHGATVASNRWYHVAVTFHDATHTGTVSIWDGTTGTLLGTDAKKTNFSPMVVTDAALGIGGLDNNWWAIMNGLMDEVVVFNDVLTPQEITQIREGTYSKLKK